MKVISIDLGATSGRVMVVSEEQGKLSYKEAHRFPNRTYRNEQGTLCWDFYYLFNEVVDGIKAVLLNDDDISSIGIDTWGVDFGLIGKDGRLLSDPTCYRDGRTIRRQKDFLSKISYSEIYSITGIQNRHFNTIYQLYESGIDFDSVSSLLLIPDLIAYFLTGEKRREETNASTTALYNRKEKKIDSSLLSLLRVPERIFPKMIYPGETYGYRKEEFLPSGREKKIPVVAVCTHDTGSAVLGTNGVAPFSYLSSGTWSLLGTELKNPLMNDKTYKANFTNEIGYGSTIRFLKNTRGRFLINETRNNYRKQGINIPVSSIAEMVHQAGDISSLLNVDDPCFETPGDRLRKINDYLEKTGQEKPKSPGEMRKRIYSSRALAYRHIIESLVQLTGENIDSLIVVGGGNRASVLNQYTANATKRKVVTGASEATVLGNAICQFIALGVFSSREEGRQAITKSIDGSVYYPQEVHIWDEKYRKFINLIQKGE